MDNKGNNRVTFTPRRKRFKRGVALLCALVLMLTVHSLKMDADTLEHIPTCGLEEHTHTAACYDEAGNAICGLEEHIHTDACFQESPVRVEPVEADSESRELTLGDDPADFDEASPDDTGTEAAPVAFDLSEPLLLSQIALEPPLLLETVVEVAPVEETEAQAGLVGVEALDGDWLIYALEDFEQAELAVVTQTDVRTLTLVGGRALRAVESEIGAPEEAPEGLSLEGEASPVEDEDTPEAAPGMDAIEIDEAPELSEDIDEVSEPVQEPEEAELPEEAEQPEDAGEPEEAEQPEETGEPEQAEQPEETEEPEDAEQAEQPEDAEEPEEAEQPEDAGEPEQAEQPEDAEEPEEAEQAEQPEEAEEPEEAEQAEASEGGNGDDAEPSEGNGRAAAAASRIYIEYDFAQTEETSVSLRALIESNADASVGDAAGADGETVEAPGQEAEAPEEAAGTEAPDETADAPVEADENEAAGDDETEVGGKTTEVGDDEAAGETIETFEAVEADAPEAAVEPMEAEPAEASAVLGGEEEAPGKADEAEEAPEAIGYDADLVAVDAADGDYIVTPIADFEAAEITWGRYVFALLNGRAASDHPAQSFAGATEYVSVSVTAAEGAFPAGTTMTVTDIDDADILEGIAEKAEEGFVRVERVHAVDITFRNADGEEIEPLIPISVVMTVKEVEADRQAVVVHVDGDERTEIVETSEEALADEAVEAVEEGNFSVGFVADAFSVYGLAVGQRIDTKVIGADGNTYYIEVTYTEDAHIPAGAALDVTEVTGDGQYLAQARESLSGDKLITLARFFDIKIMDGENEVHPDAPVEVRVWLDGKPAEAAGTAEDATTQEADLADETAEEAAPSEDAAGEDAAAWDIDDAHTVVTSDPEPRALHFVEGGDAEPETADARESADAVVFSAEGFSVWGVVYTVDFYYGNYEYHMKGEGSMTLSALFDVLGIEEDAAKVAGVRFTDDALIQVEQVENDWLLTSLAPFDTEEALTVTMEDGTVYVVRVEDALYAFYVRINDYSLGTLGGTYVSGSINGITKYTVNGEIITTAGGDNIVAIDMEANKDNLNANLHYGLQAVPKENISRAVSWETFNTSGEKIYYYNNKTNGNLIITANLLSTAYFFAYFAPINSKLIRVVKNPSNGKIDVKQGTTALRQVDPNSAYEFCYSSDNTVLVATPNSNYFFKGWYANGECISTDREFDVSTVAEDTIISAEFDSVYTYNTIANEYQKGYFYILAWGNTEFKGTELMDLPSEAMADEGLCSFRFPVQTWANDGNYEFVYWLRDDGAVPITDENGSLAGFMDSSQQLRDHYNELTRNTTYVAFYKPKGDYLVRVNWPSEGGMPGTTNGKFPREVKDTDNNTLFWYYYAYADAPILTVSYDATQWTFLGWYHNGSELISTDTAFDVKAYEQGLETGRDLNLTPLFKKIDPNFHVWYDGSNGIGGGEVANDTFYTRIDGRGNIGGSTSVHVTAAKNDPTSVSTYADITLPTSAVAPQSVAENHFALQGWYCVYPGVCQAIEGVTDMTDGGCYKPGTEVRITGDAVFYADWFPTDYSFSQAENLASTVVDTSGFITTRVFDYNNLFNMTDSIYLDQGRSVIPTEDPSGDWTKYNREYWYMKGASTDFIFLTKVSGEGRSMNPYGRDEKNQNREVSTDGGYYTATVTQGLLTNDLKNRLFGTTNGLGKRYLGTGNLLYSYDDSTGYYYYDSDKNAASYNQNAGKFYVYDYTNMTNKSTADRTDFLPLNYGEKTFTEMYGAPNYWFGMSSEIEFFLPNAPGEQDAGGHYGNQSTKNTDMVFKFAGDDDVWVFVDDQLVLDMGGVHGKVYGEINFSTGKWEIVGEGAQKPENDPTLTYGEGGRKLDEGTLDLKEGNHTLRLYYLERGASQSNCAIYFNLAPRYRLKLHKIGKTTAAAATGVSLSGAKFGIYADRECTVAMNLRKTGTDETTNVFTTDAEGYIDVTGLVAGKSYYIRELEAPAGYPDVSEEVITLTLASDGTPSVTSTLSSFNATVSSSETNASTRGTFVLSLEATNIQNVSITAKKIWAYIDGTQFQMDENSVVTVKLQRRKEIATPTTADKKQYNVRLITRYYADKDNNATNRDDLADGRIKTIEVVSKKVVEGGSITFAVSAAENAGIDSVTPQYGYITKVASTDTPNTVEFYRNGGWTSAWQTGTFRLSNVQRDTEIYITFIGTGAKDSSLGTITAETQAGETTYALEEDSEFNASQDAKWTANLSKANSWKTSWDNLPVVGSGDVKYYYYVKEISSTDPRTQNPIGGDAVESYVAAYSSDGLSGGGTITVRNVLQANKVRLRKRTKVNGQTQYLQGAKFRILTEAEYDAIIAETASAGEKLVGTNSAYWLDDSRIDYDSELDVFVSRDDGKFYSGFLPFGTYYVQEVTAPVGYQLLEGYVRLVVTADGMKYTLPGKSEKSLKLGSDGYFTLYLDDEKDERNLYDHKSVSFEKVDGSGDALSGATFGLYRFTGEGDDATTELVRLYTGGQFSVSTEDEEIHALLEAMDSGRLDLFLCETSAPRGYIGSDDWYWIGITKTVGTQRLDQTLRAFVTDISYTIEVEKWDKTESEYVPIRSDGAAIPTISVVNTPVEITIDKVSKGEMTPLTGATFTAVLVDENDPETPLVREEGGRSVAIYQREVTVDENGRATFTALPAGLYRIDETVMPDGYVKTEGPYYFTVSDAGVTGLDETLTVSHDLIRASNDEANTYIVENEPGVVLPSTGGAGTTAFYGLGSLLVLAAVALLALRRRRDADR